MSIQSHVQASIAEAASELDALNTVVVCLSQKMESTFLQGNAFSSFDNVGGDADGGGNIRTGMRPVEMTMKLDLDVSIVGEQGSLQRAQFEQDLIVDLALATGVAHESFNIKKMSTDSVLVETEIYPDPSGKGPHPLDTAKNLEKQVSDNMSMLRKGKLTSAIKEIFVSLELGLFSDAKHPIHKLEEQVSWLLAHRSQLAAFAARKVHELSQLKIISEQKEKENSEYSSFLESEVENSKVLVLSSICLSDLLILNNVLLSWEMMLLCCCIYRYSYSRSLSVPSDLLWCSRRAFPRQQMT